MKTKNWLGLGIFIIAIGSIAYFIGQSSKNQPPSAISTTATTTSDPNWQLDPPVITSMYTTRGLEQGFSLVTLGSDAVIIGKTNFSDTITNLGQTILRNSLSWSPFTNLTTTGQFVELDLTMNNNGQNRETIDTVPIGIYDQMGRYYPDSGHDQSSCGVGPSSDQTISPDIPCIQKIIFEVGKDSTSYTYKFYYKQEN